MYLVLWTSFLLQVTMNISRMHTPMPTRQGVPLIDIPLIDLAFCSGIILYLGAIISKQ